MNRRPNQSRTDYESFSPMRASGFSADVPGENFFDAHKKKKPIRRVIKWIFLLIAGILAINFAVNMVVFVRGESIPVKGLGEQFDGFTILHISDLKGAKFGPNQEILRFMLQNKEYDVAVLTGDMVSPQGNAQPLYALIDALREINPAAPVYFIPGDSDPEPVSMAYAASGSPFAPWVLGAQQRGAKLLSSPQAVTREEQTVWITSTSHLTLDVDTMQGQYEQQYLRALDGGDENEIELSKHHLQSLEGIREARETIREEDALITLSHIPPMDSELLAASGTSLLGQIDLMLCGHYLGGLMRLPYLGPVFIPSADKPLYGLFPGGDGYGGLRRVGRMWQYVSTGLGSSDSHYPPLFFRLFNPPSVTLLSLTPSSM